MKLTKARIKQIIREELDNLILEYEIYIYRDRNGRLRQSDDEGNDESADHLDNGSYDHLEPGGHGETTSGTGRGGYGRGGYGRGRYRRSYE